MDLAAAASAATKHPLPRATARTRSVPSAPKRQTWHVQFVDGGGLTIAAHDCAILKNGTLSFYLTPADSDTVIVTAFSPALWRIVDLVDHEQPGTPYVGRVGSLSTPVVADKPSESDSGVRTRAGT